MDQDSAEVVSRLALEVEMHLDLEEATGEVMEVVTEVAMLGASEEALEEALEETSEEASEEASGPGLVGGGGFGGGLGFPLGETYFGGPGTFGYVKTLTGPAYLVRKENKVKKIHPGIPIAAHTGIGSGPGLLKG
ncbi:hypothetical protein MRX96_009801 [Rhipicephalus microplus]